MNVTELFELTEWLKREVKQTRLLSLYQDLLNILQHNSQPNQGKASFEEQQKLLISTLEGMPLEQLTKSQLDFLERIKISELIGKQGAINIETILYRSGMDISTAVAKIQKLTSQLHDKIAKINQINEGLKDTVDESITELDGEALIRVMFFDKASISNVKDFKDWGANWHDIGRGIAMANGLTPEEVRIVGAAKGSVIIEIATLTLIAVSLGRIINEGLKVAEKVLDIRKKALEIQELKLKNQKLHKELEAEADGYREQSTAIIIAQEVKILKLVKDKDGEKIAALTKAVEKLIDFISKGGELDFVVPEEAEEYQGEGGKSEFSELRILSENIRLLENKLKVLGYNGHSDTKVGSFE